MMASSQQKKCPDCGDVIVRCSNCGFYIHPKWNHPCPMCGKKGRPKRQKDLVVEAVARLENMDIEV